MPYLSDCFLHQVWILFHVFHTFLTSVYLQPFEKIVRLPNIAISAGFPTWMNLYLLYYYFFWYQYFTAFRICPKFTCIRYASFFMLFCTLMTNVPFIAFRKNCSTAECWHLGWGPSYVSKTVCTFYLFFLTPILYSMSYVPEKISSRLSDLFLYHVWDFFYVFHTLLTSVPSTALSTAFRNFCLTRCFWT